MENIRFYKCPVCGNIVELVEGDIKRTRCCGQETNDEEMEEWNFKSITEDTGFYLNENNNVVICFNEGDVGPMSMGTVEFEIPADVVNNIRK